MTDALKALETMVESQLAKEPLPTPERIRELIQQVRQLPMCQVTDAQADKLALDFEERHGVSMSVGSTLSGDDHEPWLNEAKSTIDPYYWGRYKKLLIEKGLSGHVLATLDQVTDKTLGLLERPTKPGQWDRRGMVVGHVQSGKTANYIGLICKAADAGYKLIVVIAGIHNNLRNQTQLRIDEGFVGRDSSRLMSATADAEQKFIGVGRFDKSRRPVTFTNSVRDFSKTMATGVGVPLKNLNEPVVFVIKKNSSTLKNLLEWLKEHNAKSGTSSIDAPMLLIDDEADNASINIRKGSDEVSRINGQLRELLNIFDRSCYVGYTATPFANIFIDPNSADEMRGADLFPRHFIVSLDPPSNYFGATQVFIDDAEAIIRHIEDNEVTLPIKHLKDFEVIDLPSSLKKAVRTFIVARALRLCRGHDGCHSSMLVNTSRFTNVQRQLRNEIHALVDRIKSAVRVNGALPAKEALKDDELSALHAAWLEEYEPHDQTAWEAIQSKLQESVSPVIVAEVNSASSGGLAYAQNEKSGLNVIAVGGFSLSRGLTLEGLMVSYFLRNSMMYDTLMQMGRWFGYRPGYQDLCRIWMPEEAEGWYAHIAESIEELRDELRKMEAANATPEQFGLKVRSHPDTLIVTARNKMGSGEQLVVSIGLANKFVETATLKKGASIAKNRQAALALTQILGELGFPLKDAEAVRNGWLITGAPVEAVANFIAAFDNHAGSMLTENGPVGRYIADRASSELAHWDILFTSLKEKEETGLHDTSLGIPVNCQRRSPGKSDSTTLRITNKQRVSSRGVEKAGLSVTQIADAQQQFLDARGIPSGTSVNYPDRIYRAVRPRPLLIIHLLAIGTDGEDLSKSEPVVAWSISFPSTLMDEKKVEYVVNTTWLRENYGADLDDEEMDGDE